MRSLFARIATVAAVASAGAAMSVSAAQASFGVSKWEAGTCKVTTCEDKGKTPETEYYTQAAGHPDYGITLFQFNTKPVAPLGALEPEGQGVKDIRVDLPPGLAVNPEATAQCTEEQLAEEKCPKESQVGEDVTVGTVVLNEVLIKILEAEEKLPPGIPPGTKLTSPTPESFPVFNMVRKPGEPARFGIQISSLVLTLLGINERVYMEGGISWYPEPIAANGENSGVASGDYHEYFKISEVPKAPELVSSKLIFWGVPQEHTKEGTPKAFLTMPSTCNGPQITRLHVDSYEEPGKFLAYENTTPVGASGCESLEFKPTIALTPETTQSDTPDGLAATIHVPQYTEEPERPNSPTLQTAAVTLPEGLTLNAAAAHGLEGCTNAQFGLGTNAPVGCPASSQIGSVTIDAPGVPNGSLKGQVYLGAQQSQNPESGEEFRMLLAAEAPEYGVGVRLEGHVKANAQTGQLTAVFSHNPAIPFENLQIKLNGGPTAPLANPLQCGQAQASASLTPYSAEPAASITSTPFTVDADGKGGACQSPLPFGPTQTTTVQPETAGAYSSFTLQVARTDGQQYIDQVQATLPPGLLAAIPSITLCTESQAAADECPTASEIGTVAVQAGAGSSPYTLNGQAYLTGPYNGAPYGMLLKVPATAGPFNLGVDVVRATINVDPHTARLTVSAEIPKVFGGVPLRLRSVTVAVTRANYLFNPTNCGVFATESVFGGFTPGSATPATESVSTPFQVTGCNALAFSPQFTASTAAKPTRQNGASLIVKIAQAPHQANIESVVTQLPKQLPSRLTTLRQACTGATFSANPANCPSGSIVGTATLSTPVLPEPMQGYAYFVSFGNAAFPDLDLLLKGGGVTIILVGQTNISKAGITTSSFTSLPDVPISSFELDLPVGPKSALTSNGGFCQHPLVMPTTITAQNNAVIKQSTTLTVTGCAVAIVGHKTHGHSATVTVKTPSAGRVSASGAYLKTRRIQVGTGKQLKFKVQLNAKGITRLRAVHTLRIRVRIGFVPSNKEANSKSFATLTFHG